MVFVLHRLDFDLHEDLELVRLDLAVDDGPQAAAQEIQRVMVLGQGGVLVENAASMRVGDVFFQRDHPVAAAQHEQLVESLEQLLVGRLRVGVALEGAERLLDEANEHMLRRHGDHRAQGGTADHNIF